ncbi:lysophospholipid acyltransferase family protein [Candidatus Omnitrophota bacterium]
MFSYLLYRLGQLLAVHMPLKACYRVAIFISDSHYAVADKDRKRVTGNLRVIFPGKTQEEIAGIRIRMFRNFAKYLVDFFRVPILNRDNIKERVKIENLQYIDQTLSRGKGAVILSAHLGNWELGGIAMGLAGYPISAVALEHKDKRVNDFFNSRREGRGMKVIPFSHAVRRCLTALRDNELVALVGDRDFNERGEEIDFFGKPTLFPRGPAAFALKTGAAIVPAFVMRNDDDTTTLRFEKPIIPDGTNDVRTVIEQYKPIIENQIRRYPQQWFMFRRFWIG